MVASSLSELIILRHAEAGQEPAGGADAERSLTAQGRRDASRQGRFLARSGCRPQLLLSSVALRAMQTSALVRAEFAAEPGADPGAVASDRRPCIIEEERLYLAPLAQLLKILGKLRRPSGPVLLVGHNPGLHALIEHLTDSPLELPPWGRSFPPASLARIALSRDWAELPRGCGALIQLRSAAGVGVPSE